jgi:hypothetical protein
VGVLVRVCRSAKSAESGGEIGYLLVDTRYLPAARLISHAWRFPTLVSAQFLWRHVVEDKSDPVFGTLVHHAVVFLVIDFIGLANLQLVRPAIDHETDPGIGGNWDVDPVAPVERRVRIHMRLDLAANQQLGRHGPDDAATRWVTPTNDIVHHGDGHIGESVPSGLLANIELRPVVQISKNQHDGFGLPVDLIGLLAIFILTPGGVFLGKDSLDQCGAVDRSEFADKAFDIHQWQLGLVFISVNKQTATPPYAVMWRSEFSS